MEPCQKHSPEINSHVSIGKVNCTDSSGKLYWHGSDIVMNSLFACFHADLFILQNFEQFLFRNFTCLPVYSYLLFNVYSKGFFRVKCSKHYLVNEYLCLSLMVVLHKFYACPAYICKLLCSLQNVILR